MEPEGTGNVGSVGGALELPRFLELGRQPRKRCGEILHLKPEPVIGLPLHNLLGMTRPVLVRDPDSGADDARRLDLEHCNLDAR